MVKKKITGSLTRVSRISLVSMHLIQQTLVCGCFFYALLVCCEAGWPEAGSNQPYLVWEDCVKSKDTPIGTLISDTCPVGSNADDVVGTGQSMEYEFDFQNKYGFAPECPRGCFSNARFVNCTQCEWPFSTVWEQSPYCVIIQFVPVESHTLTWVVIIISVAAVFGATLFIANGDVDTIKLSCVSAVPPLIDTVSDIGMLFMAEIFNLTYINTSHTNGADQTATCTGLGPFSLWTTFFIFIFVIPNLDYVKYIMFDCHIKSRLNLAYPYPWCGEVDGDASSSRTFINRSAELAWNACINVVMLPWILYGAFLYQAGLLGINCYWNYWITVWCGNTDQCRPLQDREGRAKVNTRLIKLSQSTHFLCETIPMTVLYTFDLFLRSVSLVSQNGELQASVIPFGITLLTLLYGLVDRLLRYCYKKEEEETVVTVSLFMFCKRVFPVGDDEEEEEKEDDDTEALEMERLHTPKVLQE